MIVLDASALLALLFREAGARQVGARIEEAAMSAVSLAEVIGRLVRDGRPVNQVAERIAALEIEIYPLDAARAAAAAALQPSCQPLGLSLGDRCCLALAMELAVPALTADRTWLQLQPPGPAVIAIR